MKLLLKILFLSLLLITTASSAQEAWRAAVVKVNYKNSKLVPPFCQVNSPQYKAANWKQRLGPDFTWINHYCSAKARIPVCWKYPTKQRNECLTAHLEGSQYAIAHSKNPNYALLPLLYTEQGILLKDLKRYGEAIQSFQSAIKKNRKYIPAYTKLADTYILIKDFTAAEKTIHQGLKYKKSKALKRRLKKLDAARK